MKTGIRLTAAVLISLFVISAAGCANEKSLSSETGGHTDSSQTPPAAADILKKATLSREEQISLYKEIVEGETAWLASLQLDNGALPMTYAADGKLTLNPYFSDFAALAMLESDKYLGQVKNMPTGTFRTLIPPIRIITGLTAPFTITRRRYRAER